MADPIPMMTLRGRLRRDTEESHRTLDAGLSSLDLTTAAGLAQFLSVHVLAFAALAGFGGGLAAPVVPDLLRRAQADLVRLGAPRPAALTRHVGPLDPLALDYVVLGSRQGSAVLRTRWLAAQDGLVCRADAYFSAPSHRDLWRHFCREAKARPAHGAAADRIVADANAVFGIFLRAAGTAGLIEDAAYA